MGIIERYSRSISSSNLKSGEHHFDTDNLAAVALSSCFGAKLFRVKYANDASSYQALLAEWETMVGVKSVLRKWPQHVKYLKVARLSLDHWLNDLCPECGGKGVKPLPDIPNVLSDDPCQACNGTGLAKINCEKRDLKYVEDMTETLHDLSRYAAGQAMRKLASDMDF